MDGAKRPRKRTVRCCACRKVTPEYDITHSAPEGEAFILFCNRCLNARMAEKLGVDGFEHIDFEPISLADVAPFYSRVESIFRVTGRKEGWAQFPDGNFVETTYPPDSQTIKRFTEVANQRGIGVSKMRAAQGINGLASSINLLLPDAVATGKLDIVSNAIVRQLTVDKNTGLVNGAHFVDRHSRRELQVKAKVVVLAAGSLESTRLLLNSGIANSSGVMGHYLMDQLYGVSRSSGR